MSQREREGEGGAWAHRRRLVLKTAKIVCWTQTRARSGCYCSKKIWALLGGAELLVESPPGPPGRSSREVTHCLVVSTVSWLWNSPPLLAFSLPGNLTLEEEGVSPLPLTHSYHTSFLLNVKVKSPWWPHWDSRARKAKHVTIWSLDCRSLMRETGWYVDFWMGYQDLSLWNCRHVRLVSIGQWFRVSST